MSVLVRVASSIVALAMAGETKRLKAIAEYLSGVKPSQLERKYEVNTALIIPFAKKLAVVGRELASKIAMEALQTVEPIFDDRKCKLCGKIVTKKYEKVKHVRLVHHAKLYSNVALVLTRLGLYRSLLNDTLNLLVNEYKEYLEQYKRLTQHLKTASLLLSQTILPEIVNVLTSVGIKVERYDVGFQILNNRLSIVASIEASEPEKAEEIIIQLLEHVEELKGFSKTVLYWGRLRLILVILTPKLT